MERDAVNEPGIKILAVDDNQDSLYALEKILLHQGYQVVTAKRGDEAFTIAEQERPAAILLDVMMPGLDGFQTTEKLKRHPELRYIPVVLVTARDSLTDVVQGLSRGADDYITKPFKPDELLARLRAVIRMRELYTQLQQAEQQNEALLGELVGRYDFKHIVGSSPAMKQVFSLLEKVSDADSPVLIYGPTGTGKELVARGIHFNSKRRRGPFIAQNCAAFSEHLLESELFGHVRGAFTGAVRDKKGLFEAAAGGTLFLDEIGEMPLAMQAKLLRVLQDGCFMPVGSTTQKHSNARILAATNRDLSALSQEGKFREDLYYRLNVVGITLPPLKSRREDIPALVDHFLERYVQGRGGSKKSVSPQLLELLCQYEWRGNIRELENEVERLLILGADLNVLPAELLSERIVNYFPMEDGVDSLNPNDSDGGSLRDAVRRVEESCIRESLKKHGGNKSTVARELGISRSNLIAKVKQYGIEGE